MGGCLRGSSVLLDSRVAVAEVSVIDRAPRGSGDDVAGGNDRATFGFLMEVFEILTRFGQLGASRQSTPA